MQQLRQQHHLPHAGPGDETRRAAAYQRSKEIEHFDTGLNHSGDTAPQYQIIEAATGQRGEGNQRAYLGPPNRDLAGTQVGDGRCPQTNIAGSDSEVGNPPSEQGHIEQQVVSQ